MRLARAAALLALLLASAALAATAGGGAERTIAIAAKRYAFEPEEITLERGEPVVLVLTTADRAHGFNLSALGIRAEAVPGQATRVRLVPERTGTFVFHCDLFCGEGHDEMGGQIIVIE